MGLPLILYDTEDLVEFIARRYRKAKKIVEVGVGAYPWIAKGVKERLPGVEVVVTDTNEETLAIAKKAYPEIKTVLDDILKPRLKIYEKADLIYSLRPPPEMVHDILELASKVGCDVLIRPFSDEEGGYAYSKEEGWRLMTHGRAVFYWLGKFRHSNESSKPRYLSPATSKSTPRTAYRT